MMYALIGMDRYSEEELRAWVAELQTIYFGPAGKAYRPTSRMCFHTPSGAVI